MSESGRSERVAGAKEGKQSGSGGLLPCARAVVSGGWGERSERWWGCGNAGTGKPRAGTQIYLRGGLAVAVFPHPLNCRCFAF